MVYGPGLSVRNHSTFGRNLRPLCGRGNRHVQKAQPSAGVSSFGFSKASLSASGERDIRFAWQARHLAKSGAGFTAGERSAQIWKQAHHFRKVMYRCCGRSAFARMGCSFPASCITFARSDANFVAGTNLSLNERKESCWTGKQIRR